LQQARRAGRLPHAYLFWGPPGVGKTRAALGLAQLLLCERASAEGVAGSEDTQSDPLPCGACPPCQRVARLTHPDLHLVLPGTRATEEDPRRELEAYAQDPYHCLDVPHGASIGIERIRGLKLEASKARVERGCRVIVIRDAERLTLEAAQAALKLIEEPQAETFLVLTCTDPSHLLPTILSRCRRLRFRALPAGFLAAVVRERMNLSEAGARVVAGLAQGSLSRALELAEMDAPAVRDEALELFERPPRDAADAAARVLSLGRAWSGDRARLVVDLLMSWYGDILAARYGLPEEDWVHADRAEALRRQAQALSLPQLRRRVAALEELLAAIEQNVNPALALEAALLRIHALAE
jgi:DNA polymerase-3 subunit delta'